MKNRFLLRLAIMLLGIMLGSTRAEAQTISYTDITPVICSMDTFLVLVSGASSADTVVAYYGDGTSFSEPVSFGTAYFTTNHPYPAPGLYTLKLVLTASGVPVDSIHMTETYTCTEIQCFVYDDINADCIFDAGDTYIYGEPTTIEIDSAGVPLDTITTTCGFTYPVVGPTGTIYAFKVIGIPYGYSISCAGDSVRYDTIGTTVHEPSIGFVCNTTDTFDLAIWALMRPGITGAEAPIFVTNSSCTPTPTAVTINYSPDYVFDSIWYGVGLYSYTVSGNSVTFNLGNVSSNSHISFLTIFSPVVPLSLGDTINTSFVLDPLIGDVDTANNFVIICDTVRDAWDPNYKSVMPTGNIEPGTLLKYMIGFENTGNDTAFNIHIMDTISNNLDINTFKVVSCSAPMNLIMLNNGTNTIVKFDFPNINLLDTAQHTDFSGMVTYTIQAKTGLAAGTKIDNEAGIYFDANAVVMTNNVENIIGGPASVATISNVNAIHIYPNPTTDIVNITGVQQNTSYNLMDITGACMQQGVLTPGSNTLSIKNFAPGIYILEVTDGMGNKTANKVVKE